MNDAVTVSAVDVQRARLLLRLNQTLGTTSADYVVRIAQAQPASPARPSEVADDQFALPHPASDDPAPDDPPPDDPPPDDPPPDDPPPDPGPDRGPDRG